MYLELYGCGPDSPYYPFLSSIPPIRPGGREKGFLIGLGGTYGNVLRIQPPLVIEAGDLQLGMAALEACLRTL